MTLQMPTCPPLRSVSVLPHLPCFRKIKKYHRFGEAPPASPPVNTVSHHTYNWVMVTGTKTLISSPPHTHNVYFVTGHLVKRLIVLINLPRVHLDLPSGIFQVSGSSHPLSLFWFDICVFHFRFCPADSPGQLATGDAAAQGRSACPRESFLCFPVRGAPAEDGC